MRTQPGETPESLDFEHSKKRSVFSQVKSLVTYYKAAKIVNIQMGFLPN